MSLNDKHLSIDIAIEGMSCASCVDTIEKAISNVPNTTTVSVNLSTERAHIELSKPTAVDSILDAVVNAGYKAQIITSEDRFKQIEESEQQHVSIIIAALLSLPLVTPMVLDVFGIHVSLPSYIQLILATPVQFYFGAGFYQSAWKAILNKTGNMDLLVAIGTSAAFLLSIYMMVQGHPHLYFEASSVVITLVFLGKWL
jgi:Cu+-exporting ATPase